MPLEGLAPPPNAILVFNVEPFSLNLDVVDSNMSSSPLGKSLDPCDLVLLRGKRYQCDWVPSCLKVLRRLVALLSWWIAPLLPLPRSGLNCAQYYCLLLSKMCVVVHFDLCLVFDQKLSSPELFLVVLGSCQGVCTCLIEVSHRISQLLWVNQCFLVDQNAHLLIWYPLESSNWLYLACSVVWRP